MGSEMCIRDRREEASRLRKDLAYTQKELSATRNSNELLLTLVSERDSTIAGLRERIERNIAQHVENDKRIAILERERENFGTMNAAMEGQKGDGYEKWTLKVKASNRERDGFAQQLEEANKRSRILSIGYNELVESIARRL